MTHHPKDHLHTDEMITEMVNRHLANMMQEALDRDLCTNCALNTLALSSLVNVFAHTCPHPLAAADHGSRVVAAAIGYIKTLDPKNANEWSSVMRASPKN
jgi:hypothetical protein